MLFSGADNVPVWRNRLIYSSLRAIDHLFKLKWVELWNRIISTHASHCVLTVAWHIFICVDAANEAVHELVAEPVQEPRAVEQQEDAVEHTPEDLVNSADLQGKPRSITSIFSMQRCYLNIVHLSF